jgi:hypothetical protein
VRSVSGRSRGWYTLRQSAPTVWLRRPRDRDAEVLPPAKVPLCEERLGQAHAVMKYPCRAQGLGAGVDIDRQTDRQVGEG